MSGRPYTYGRAMAIAQLMRDMRRPVLQEMAKKDKPYNTPQTIYKHGEDLYVSYCDTIDWVPKLSKLTKYGREARYLTADKIAVETDNREQFPAYWSDILKKQLYIEPIEGWPTEEEIAAEIASSAEREKNWNGTLAANDLTAIKRLLG
jgi:hypothetical protein